MNIRAKLGLFGLLLVGIVIAVWFIVFMATYAFKNK